MPQQPLTPQILEAVKKVKQKLLPGVVRTDLVTKLKWFTLSTTRRLIARPAYPAPGE
jgi:hypothetical protein